MSDPNDAPEAATAAPRNADDPETATAAPRDADDPEAATAAPPDAPVRVSPVVLKKRREFLAASRGRKCVTPGLVLQARRRKPDETAEAPVRIGFTASKKVGNAVLRNRAKRRMRALSDALLPTAGRPGWDYVLIARAETTVARPFSALRADLAQAIERVHAPAKPTQRRDGGSKPRAEGRAEGRRRDVERARP